MRLSSEYESPGIENKSLKGFKLDMNRTLLQMENRTLSESQDVYTFGKLMYSIKIFTKRKFKIQPY